MNDVFSDRRSSHCLSNNVLIGEFDPPLMLPMLVDESLIRRFKYWHDGIRDAMIFRSQIYICCDSYPVTERVDAFEIAALFSSRKYPACITVSDAHYIVWRNVRSLV
ncbi:MAG: hypothetical protein VKK04_03445 [Synechococcales bacterium]|nr:hypothetical protein [Synechococcales bacterium]